MSVAESKHLLNEMNSSKLCVDFYENGTIRGKVCSPYFYDNIEFDGMIHFIKIMDQIFDHFNLPQRSMEVRHFSGEAQREVFELPERIDPDKVNLSKIDYRGEIATFRIKVLFRRNASWQGTVAWIEGGKEEHFRSVLELIFLLNGALRFSMHKKEL